jgi:4-amino-4-deoxy-L-arabinose transferase-like glycosyltransferase
VGLKEIIERQADWVLGALLVGLGFLIRWHGLHRQSLWVDEMSSYGLSLVPMRHIPANVVVNDAHPPLYIMLVHAAHGYFHLGTIDSLRVPSLLAGTACIAIVYLLGLLLSGRLAAVVASALAVLSPVAVWYSREGRMYAVTWFFTLLSFLLLVKAVRSRNWRWLPAYAVSVALSLYSDVSAVLAIVPEAAVIGWFVLRSGGRERALWFRIGVAYALGWLLFTPWLTVLPKQLPLLNPTFTGFEPSLSTAWQLLLNLTGLAAVYASLYDLLVPLVLAAVVLVVLAGALAVVSWSGRREPLPAAMALALTLGPALMCALFVFRGSPGVLLPRVMSILPFGLALAAGEAAAWLKPRLSRGRAGIVPALSLAVLVISAGLALATVDARGWNGQSWDRVAKEVSERVQPGDALIYYPVGLKFMVDAYLPPGSIWAREGVGIWSAPVEVADSYFQQWASGHPRVWLVFYASGGIDMPAHDRWFREHGYQRVLGDPEASYGLLEYVPMGHLGG